RNRELEQLVAERTGEIRRQEVALREVSRRAGMAEVATGVLHNVGNVFNGVNVSVSTIGGMVRRSKALDVQRAVGLLRDHLGDLPGFLTTDERGRQLPGYLIRATDQLVKEREGLLGELENVDSGISHVTQIISAQQSLAGAGGVEEEIDLGALIDETLRLHTQGWAAEGIAVEVEREPLPPVLLDRPQFVQIFVNLLTNARNAVLHPEAADRRILVRLGAVGEPPQARIQVLDTGVGIAPEHLVSIFNYGFTMRPNGRGFGLHSAANASRQMGGALRVESPGLGQGATFTLEIPLTSSTNGKRPK
ncbi:MAG: HAMP domain-containing histidine kinase, partial [Gemmatimonadales bacterium]|nr:HAMP domain-containing histidine kinase [Gemmatimonadales bacterium]